MTFTDPRLQELTDKFLNEFIELGNEIEKEKHGPDHTPHEGYHFDTSLPNCISESKIIYDLYSKHPTSMPMLGRIFAERIVKNFFNNDIQGFRHDIQKAIDNYNFPKYDYCITDLEESDEVRVENEIAFNHDNDTPGISFVDVPNNYHIKRFKTNNYKSGHSQKVEVSYKNGVMHSIVFRNEHTNEDMLYINILDDIDTTDIDNPKPFVREEGKLTSQRHCNDINGAFYVIYFVANSLSDKN